MSQSNLLQTETNKQERKMKFTDWYFLQDLDVSTRTDLVVPRKDFFAELEQKMKNINSHTMIFAYPGQGKTLSTKHFFNLKSIEDPTIKMIYINCKEYPTEKRIFSKMITEMSKTFPPAKEIAKKNERVAVREFVKNVPLGDTYYLVLDEIDVPVTNDRKSHKGEFLTALFRAEDSLYDLDHPMKNTTRKMAWHTIMITNKLAFENTLDRNERQHIQHMGIKPYNPQDIFDIIKKRMDSGINTGNISVDLFSDQIMFRIAKITVDAFESNVRTAFRLVVACAEQAIQGNTSVTKEHLDEATKNVEIDLLMDDIQDIPNRARAFFFSVLIFLKNKVKMSGFKNLEEKGYSYKSFYLHDIYGVFKKFCIENGIKHLKSEQRSCQGYVAEGQKMGMYTPTGVTNKHYREYRIDFDINVLWNKILNHYPNYNFDISLM